MKNFIKREIRKLINEIFGVQTNITKISKQLAIETFRRIQNEKENIAKDKNAYFFENVYQTSEEFRKDTKISRVIINPIFYKEHRFPRPIHLRIRLIQCHHSSPRKAAWHFHSWSIRPAYSLRYQSCSAETRKSLHLY